MPSVILSRPPSPLHPQTPDLAAMMATLLQSQTNILTAMANERQTSAKPPPPPRPPSPPSQLPTVESEVSKWDGSPEGWPLYYLRMLAWFESAPFQRVTDFTGTASATADLSQLVR